ncbi:HAD family hydrolase [Prauserella muralis]|uniref:Haloacid dehalogenase n=1 Tax=Prauserella muralis TaxID=588067 RepID=A0A2V4ANW3_9PSEU|nr:HAD family hydrolase [Prauserella muralis]PXY21329.1 haloacid dehalogenase [Prauserella muralis]TWE30455.1 2-haloacid dehalogenase [Prauserella muralis]
MTFTDPTPELLTFDTYGTLIDWDTALRNYVADLVAAKEIPVSPADFYETWYYQHALPMLAGPFKLYRQLLKDSLQDALRSHSAEVAPDDGDDFGDAMAEADPFPDTLEFLHRVAPHFRLGTISNSQDDIISHAVKRMDNVFELVITAETTHAYKPAPALFELILARAGVAARNTVHIAQSQYVDLPRSVPMGMRTIWVNRNAQTLNPGVPEPHAVVPDLRGVPQLLGVAG